MPPPAAVATGGIYNWTRPNLLKRLASSESLISLSIIALRVQITLKLPAITRFPTTGLFIVRLGEKNLIFFQKASK
jgi:hypothetical protein